MEKQAKQAGWEKRENGDTNDCCSKGNEKPYGISDS